MKLGAKQVEVATRLRDGLRDIALDSQGWCLPLCPLLRSVDLIVAVEHMLDPVANNLSGLG